MIKAVVVVEDVQAAGQMTKHLNDIFGGRICFKSLPLTGDLIGSIKVAEADLLVTLDLAGFDRTTLTDHISYNLLDCKQIHFIARSDLNNECILKKPLSIAMFFCCVDDELYKHLQNNYPNIPWMKCMERWQKDEAIYSAKNTEEIGKVIELVLEKCRM